MKTLRISLIFADKRDKKCRIHDYNLLSFIRGGIMLDSEKKTTIEQLNLQGRNCLYREKGLLLNVKIEEAKLRDNFCHIEISYLSPKTTQQQRNSIGSALEYISVEQHGLFVGGYISFYIIFDEDLLRQLESIFKNHPQLDSHARLIIANDAAYAKIKPIEFYLD